MSNSLAIAAVTSTIRYVLDRALQQPHPGAVGASGVTTVSPAELALQDTEESPRINVYCYQATPNHAWNLTDLPTRRGGDASFVQRPIAALDLHYLVSCVGNEASLVPQRLLGRVVVALAATSVLTRDVVTTALTVYGGETETAFLTESDLASEVELVKLSPTPLSLEELSKLWGVLDTPYVLSLAYLATVVLIAADVTPRVALPVRRRELSVTPAGPPRIETVETDPPLQHVGAGTTLVVRGSRLLGPGHDGPDRSRRAGARRGRDQRGAARRARRHGRSWSARAASRARVAARPGRHPALPLGRGLERHAAARAPGGGRRRRSPPPRSRCPSRHRCRKASARRSCSGGWTAPPRRPR